LRDPSERSAGSWPRDRPIRWGSVAGNLTWFVVGTAAALVQLGLVVPFMALGGSLDGDGPEGLVRIGLALIWGGLTLFAAWSWVLGRWRVVLAPAATAAVLFVASTAFAA
jgi:hypothetical protein